MKKLDLEREEPLLVNTEPEANNNMTSRAIFYQRKLYEKEAFSRIPFTNPTIDLWYRKLLYGRVGMDGRAIHLSESKLAQIPGTPDMFAVDFVVDAFNDFRNYYVQLARRDKICPDGILPSIVPKRAFVSLNQLYHETMVQHYETFKEVVRVRKRDKKIKNFENFMKVFTEFVDTLTPQQGVTRSHCVVSRFNSPLSSGLIIELATDRHSDDKPKVEKYLQDPNFRTFKLAAERFGFAIDKHAPWRLVADLSSPAMKTYLDAKGTTVEGVLSDYYYRSFEHDLETLKVYVIQFYNTFILDNPTIVNPVTVQQNSKFVVRAELTTRLADTLAQIDNRTSDDFWLRVYAYIRGREENKGWSQFQFEKIVRNAFQFEIALDNSAAIRYIDKQVTEKVIYDEKQRHFKWLGSGRLK